MNNVKGNETPVLDYGSRTMTIPAGRPAYEEVVRTEVETWTPLTTRQEAFRLLTPALKVAPWLGSKPALLGGTLATDEGLLMIAHCADWIRTRKPRQTINRGFCSYYWKHMVEEARRKQGDDPLVYTSNDSFIAAAIGLGYKYRFDRPYACFNISEVAR